MKKGEGTILLVTMAIILLFVGGMVLFSAPFNIYERLALGGACIGFFGPPYILFYCVVREK